MRYKLVKEFYKPVITKHIDFDYTSYLLYASELTLLKR